ncbi:MAG: hypothetical protein QXR12_06485 [Thermofilum sp.]
MSVYPRVVPRYTSRVFVGSVSVPAGGEQVILDVKGAGELHGFTLKYSDLPALVHGWFRLYIDGQLVENSLAGIVALFFHGGTVDAGRPASPFTVTVHDAAYNVYGFSMTAPVRFTSSLRLTVVNLSNQTISVDYAAAVSLEGQ